MALTPGWGEMSHIAFFSGEDSFSQSLLRACCVLGAEKIFVCVRVCTRACACICKCNESGSNQVSRSSCLSPHDTTKSLFSVCFSGFLLLSLCLSLHLCFFFFLCHYFVSPILSFYISFSSSNSVPISVSVGRGQGLL